MGLTSALLRSLKPLQGQRQRHSTSNLKCVLCLQKQGYVVLKAPSQAGKTATCQLVYERAQMEKKVFSHVYFMSAIVCLADMDFEQCLQQLCGVRLNDLWTPGSLPDRTGESLFSVPCYASWSWLSTARYAEAPVI